MRRWQKPAIWLLMLKHPVRYLLIAVALAAIVLGARPAWHQVRKWMIYRQIQQTETFLTKGDSRGAYLMVQQVLQRNPNNRDAIRLMIRLLEPTGSPEILFWKQRLCLLDPLNNDLLLDLAMSAAKLDNPSFALETLARIPESARHTPAYFQTSGAIAVASRNYAAAADAFAKVLELTPTDPQARYNLANMQIKLGKPEAVAQACKELETLLLQPDWHTPALRSLLVDARMRQDKNRAMQLATELDQQKDAIFSDHLLYLEELQYAQSPEFMAKLDAFATTCTQSVSSAYGLITWMNAHGLAARAMEWADTLPLSVRLQNPVPMSMAESCLLTQSWSKLNEFLDNTNWGALEFMRFAFQARAIEQIKGGTNNSYFSSSWDRARLAAGNDPNALNMLARMATGWKWEPQAVEVWWQLARMPFGQITALKTLQGYYENRRDTRQLLQVSERVSELDPNNLGASNNCAYYSLLLSHKIADAILLAKRNYTLRPNLPPLAATYALAKLAEKQPQAARDLMVKLPETFLQQPSVAACYGAILTACGDFAKARPYLIIASNHRNLLLPEETALSEQAIHALP